MAVVNPWIDTSLDLGPSIAPTYLNAWVAQRASMNAADKANLPDPVKLAEEEAKVRKQIADLRRAQITAETERGKQGSNVEVAKINAGARVTAADVAASADRATSLIRANTELRRIQKDREESDRKAGAVRDPDMVGALSNVGTMSAGQPSDARVDSAFRTFNDARAKIGNPPQGSLAYDGAAALAVQSLTEADPVAGQQLAEKLGASPGESWTQYQARVHSGFTDAEIADAIRKAEKYGGGGGLTAMKAFLAQFDDGGTESSKDVFGTRGPAPTDDTIHDLEKMADDLADERAKAMLMRSRYPAANELIANPNRFTNTRQRKNAQVWGLNELPYNEEVEGELERTGSLRGAMKAIGKRGGIASEGVGTGGALDLEAPNKKVEPPIDALTLTGTKEGEGGYSYTFNDDGTISVSHGDRAPTVVKPRSKAHAAIVAEFTSKRTEGLTPEQRKLFDDATVKALAGDFAGARKAAQVAADTMRGNAPVTPDYTDEQIEEAIGAREEVARQAAGWRAAMADPWSVAVPGAPTGGDSARERGARAAYGGYMPEAVMDKRVVAPRDIGVVIRPATETAARTAPGAPLKIGATPYDDSDVIAGEDRMPTPDMYMPPPSRVVSDAGFDKALSDAAPEIDMDDFDAAMDAAMTQQADTESDEYGKILSDAAKAKGGK
jgi:hypothetical protein